MGKNIARFFITLVGLFVGPGIVALILELLTTFEPPYMLPEYLKLLVYISSGIISGIVFLFISKPLVSLALKSAKDADKKISKLPPNVVIPATIGLIFGLVVAYYLSSLISSFIMLPWLAGIFNVLIYIVSVSLGISILIRYRSNFSEFFRRHKDTEEKDKNPDAAQPKLLDTSVIIDGRIFDICNTGIIEGVLIIPEFVLDELRHIADSSDDLKRNRGRRGLDILKRIQTELDLPVRIVHTDMQESLDVDAKLLLLAKDLGGIVVTNDYNLNKVASVKGVKVLNINELSNAVKPVVLPGEEMNVMVVKDGKEPGQGIAYLDDGTMIVVEGGQKEHNKPISVTVTSVIQTAAGRMIFAKLK